MSLNISNFQFDSRMDAIGLEFVPGFELFGGQIELSGYCPEGVSFAYLIPCDFAFYGLCCCNGKFLLFSKDDH